MARRLRLIKPEKQQKMIWSTPGGMSLFIIMCIMMVVLIQMLRSPGFLKFMVPKEPAPFSAGQPSSTETTQPQAERSRPKVQPRPHVALPPEEEKKLFATVVEQEPPEKKPYFYLLAKVNSMTDAQIDAGIDPAITYDTFAENPASVRGKLVKLQGLLKYLKELKFTKTSFESGFESVWEGSIVDNDLRVIGFHLTQRPPENWLKVGDDTVIVKGIYLKNVAYRDRGGGFSAAPLIIAKKLIKVVPPAGAGGFWKRYQGYVVMVVIIAGVVGLALLVHQWRVSAAMAARPRRALPEGPLELTPDLKLEPESEEQKAESEQQAQHVNPGPSEGPQEQKKE